MSSLPSAAVPHRFDPHRTSHAPGPLTAFGPRKAPRRVIDAETVVARLEEAGHTLLSLPRTALRQTQLHAIAETLDIHAAEDRPLPSALRITRMDQALAWIPLIPADTLVLRRIVGCRCLVSPRTGRHLFSWQRLARVLGADHKAVRRWHATAIGHIVATLNRDAALFRSWDSLR